MKPSASLLAAFMLALACLAAASCHPSRACRADAGCFGACPTESSHCDERSGQWVECLTDEHCSGSNPVCSPSLHTCVACATHADCSLSSHGRFCDTGTGRCGECLSNRDCGGDMPVCSLDTFTCTACTSDADCAESASGPRCDVAAGTCHRCLEDADCGGTTPACLPSTRECVGCTSNAHCASGNGKICDQRAHSCRGCVADAECSAFVRTPSCDESTGVCRQCTPDTEAQACGVYACNPRTFQCTENRRRSVAWCGRCEADSECTSGFCVDRSSDVRAFGRYCLPPFPSPDAPRAPYAPYTVLRTGPTANRASATYLSPPPTISCEGLTEYGRPCAGVPDGVVPDVTCGNPSMADGLCYSGAGVTRSWCTFACSPVGYTCAAGSMCAISYRRWSVCAYR